MLLQSEDKTVLFAVGSTLVNCTNSYEVEKPDPQMVELAKYAKQHVPEEHPKVPFQFLIIHEELHKQPMILHSTTLLCLEELYKGFYTRGLHVAVCLSTLQDAPSYVEKRLRKLLETGVVSALVCMVKQESPALTEACRDCIAR